MDPLREFAPWLAAVLGFLAGVAGPIIVDRNRRAATSRETMDALRIELRDLRYRMAGIAFVTDLDAGRVDRTYLEWCRRVFIDAAGLDRSESLLGSVERMLQRTDLEIMGIGAYSRRERETSGKVKLLKKVAAPLLDTKMGEVGTLPAAVQNVLLSVKAHLMIFNEDVEQSRYYYQTSFQNLSPENHRITADMGRQVELQAADRAKIIAEKIGGFPGLGFSKVVDAHKN